MSTEALEKKVLKLAGGKEFLIEVQRLSAEELEARISQLQVGLEESRSHKEENEALKAAKEEVALLTGPYRDVESAVKLKTKVIIDLLKEQGKA